MGSNAFFLSVMTPASASSGTLTFLLETLEYSSTLNSTDRMGGSPLVSLSVTVTGITNSLTESDIADKISAQIGTAIVQNDMEYDGTVAYTEEQIPATFQVTKTDHVVCCWSQALFRVKTVTNTISGLNIVVNESPVLVTLAEAQDIAATLSFSFKNDLGTTLSTSQIIKLLTLSSADLVSVLRNNIVLTSYVKELQGNDTSGIKIGPGPVVDFDEPRIRRKDVADNFNLPSWGKWVYFIDHSKGQLRYRREEVLVDTQSPFSRR